MNDGVNNPARMPEFVGPGSDTGPVTAVQGELDVEVPPRLFGCTPSRLTSWLDCPRRYRFTYVDRPVPAKGPPWAHNSVGATVHLALAGWWALEPDQRTPAAAGRIVREKWAPLGFRDDAQADMWRERAAEMAERYVETLDLHEEPVGVERTVALKTERLALSGRIDRLDRRGDELVVVDYKTGRSLLTEDDARGSLALAIYAVAAARTMRMPCRRVELHHVPTGEVIVWEHSEESLARHIGRAEDIASEAVGAHERVKVAESDEILETAFPPRTGPQCAWCDFLSHCAAGQAVAPQRKPPWAGLPVEISSTVDDVVD